MVLADIGLGEVLWSMLVLFVMVTYLMMLFSIIFDLFRDNEISGGTKAVWCLGLLFAPLISLLLYLIVRGEGMTKRSIARAQAQEAAAKDYIRDAAGSTPADDIAKAKSLLDQGVIDDAEFAALKQKALS